ncbi:ThiF family adenylyltransferase [uncultured Desulfovibrio sp.]|uniref:ThiF family adenylyltransferase n=1 Tax=uncultured Desulfovibrio sp. TaxID=167968 RepID=UPI0026206EAB|nr:ThiF family adenylyltransferase [uncultured Desulfovibrio sp.]
MLEKTLDMARDGLAYSFPAGVGLSRAESSRINTISARAAHYGLVPVHLHSHPAGMPDFSGYDDQEEAGLHAWLQHEGQPLLLSLVCSRDGDPYGRIWEQGKQEMCSVRIGLQTFFPPDARLVQLPALDRQRAFGRAFASAAARLRVGIVGIGGVGMPVAEQMARSGFRHFVLMDPDRVEAVNLNRLYGLRTRDIGRFKVDVAAASIRRACESVGTKASVRVYRADVNTASKRQMNVLKGCDLLLALTDDELSRITCLNLALDGGAEYLQAGVRISQVAETSVIDSIKTEVTGAEVGRYCPLCCGRLDPGQASIDARRYVGGDVWEKALSEGYVPEEPAPSVMSLNAITAGALVLEIQKRVAGLAMADLVQHDWLTGKFFHIRHVEQQLAAGDCAICGRQEA